MCEWRVHCLHFSSTSTRCFCTSITVNNAKTISARSCVSNIVQASHIMSPGHPHNEILLRTKGWHHGPAEVTGNSSWIWCSFLYVTLKTFHVIPSFHWGCLTICHPAMWSDAFQPSHPAATDFLLVPPSPIWPPGGAPLQTWAPNPHNTSLEWAKRTSHCQRCMLGRCQLFSMPAC